MNGSSGTMQAGKDGNGGELQTLIEDQSRERNSDAAFQDEDAAQRWASQDYSSYKLPAAAAASAAEVRGRQQPLSSSAASAEAASLPKDASSKSLRCGGPASATSSAQYMVLSTHAHADTHHSCFWLFNQ